MWCCVVLVVRASCHLLCQIMIIFVVSNDAVIHVVSLIYYGQLLWN